MPITTPPVDLPEWASDETQVLEPSEAKKDLGFVASEKPANQTLNWVLWDNWKWAEYFKNYLDTITNSNVLFDDTLKILKVSQGHFQSEKADTATTQTSDSNARIVVRNSNGTANNFADFSFSNQNDVITSKISSKFVNHTNKETDVSIWATPASGSMTEYIRVKGSGLIQVLTDMSIAGQLNTTGAIIAAQVGIGSNPSPTYILDVLTTSLNTAKIKNSSSLGASITYFSNDVDKQITNIIYGSAYASGTVFGINANGAATAANTAYAIGTINSDPFYIGTNGTIKATFFPSGGMNLDTPTGGDKGPGTLNASGDIYKNNSAYTNPDYAFEHFFHGKIEKFKENVGAMQYEGLKPLIELESYVKSNLRLPGIGDDGMGIFERSDFILEKIEELHLYMFNLNKRILSIESAIAKK